MSISASIQTFFPIASPKNRFFSSRPGHCRGGGSKLRTLECGGLPPLWPHRTNSEDIQLLRAILRFRSTLLRLEGTANHLFEPSNEGLVSERATRADVPAQLHRFLFRHGAVQERIQSGTIAKSGATWTKLATSFARRSADLPPVPRGHSGRPDDDGPLSA